MKRTFFFRLYNLPFRNTKHVLYSNKTIIKIGTRGVNFNNKTIELVLDKTSCSLCISARGMMCIQYKRKKKIISMFKVQRSEIIVIQSWYIDQTYVCSSCL